MSCRGNELKQLTPALTFFFKGPAKIVVRAKCSYCHYIEVKKKHCKGMDKNAVRVMFFFIGESFQAGGDCTVLYEPDRA